MARLFARICGFALGFAAILSLSLWIGRSRLDSSRVLSESEGTIRTVEIQFTCASAPETWPTIRGFLKQADPGIEVIAVCGTRADESAFQKLRREVPQHRVETVVVGAEITGWSKDRFLVARKSLLMPHGAHSALASRSNDSQVAPAIALRFPWRFRAVATGLAFDAGDIVCSSSTAFYCQELAAKNPGVRDLAQAVEELTGKKPFFIAGAPGHHVGTFAAPIDEKTLVVGDPDLGMRLWTSQASSALGEPDWSGASTGPFRSAMRCLESAGFRVLRVPAAVFGPKVYLTYTNAVFDNRGSRRIAFMPEYGVLELDQAATEVFRGAGFEVRPVPVRNVFRLCGTIGCLVNVLVRD